MQLCIIESVHNKLTDVGRWENAPYLPQIMQTGARVTESELIGENHSITEHN